jgi:hypothetical protein
MSRQGFQSRFGISNEPRPCLGSGSGPRLLAISSTLPDPAGLRPQSTSTAIRRNGTHRDILRQFHHRDFDFFRSSRGVNNFFSAAHFRQIQISGACASTPFYPYLILTQSFVGILANFSRFGLKNRHRFYTRIRRASGGLIARKPPPVARFKLIALQRIFCFFLVACPQPVCYFHARRWVETLRATARWLGH